jgi:hypothetical protein
MFQKLASHNDDIRQLIEKGYAVSLDSNCLVVRDIPYLNADKQLKIGAIVSKLVFVDDVHVQLDDHQIYFCGSHPHQLDGSPIANLAGGPIKMLLTSKDLIVERSFSNKPKGGFKNLFDKIENYVTMFCGPAMELYREVTPFTFREVEPIAEESVFKFADTLTSRAQISELSSNLKSDRVAIIGLGGTGSFILDFISRTPVAEIRAFDLDAFHVHNAFRSPGRLEKNELGKSKAEVYQARYESFRSGINIFQKYIQADSDADLQGITFAFVCVDKGSSRKEIFEVLIRMGIPFIDVGMGLDRQNGPIGGMLRVTYYDSATARAMLQQNLAPMTDAPDDIYKNNIQISELNALNACMAVIRFKQIRGFYLEDNPSYHMLLTLNDLHCASESR